MKTRTVCSLPSLDHKMSHSDKVLAIGSCFAVEIGQRLDRHKVDVTVNPLGITYNPVSIAKQIILARSAELPDPAYFVDGQDGATYHYDYHSELVGGNREQWLEVYRRKAEQLHSRSHQADWCIVTLGTAWVYCLDDKVVANCHKQPSRRFEKRLLSVEECTTALQQLSTTLPATCKIILTVSPVRHIKDGLVDNNRSKARLIEAVHQVCEEEPFFYFPSYELLIDDLRDYRYFGRDMVHPTEVAVDYIWEAFEQTSMTTHARDLNRKIKAIRQAMQHRPRWPHGPSYRDFLASFSAKVQELCTSYPDLDWTAELQYFNTKQAN